MGLQSSFSFNSMDLKTAEGNGSLISAATVNKGTMSHTYVFLYIDINCLHYLYILHCVFFFRFCCVWRCWGQHVVQSAHRLLFMEQQETCMLCQHTCKNNLAKNTVTYYLTHIIGEYKCLVFNALLIHQVHNDRISVLKLTDRTIISASYDRTVKLWDRDTKKQVQHVAEQMLHTHTHTTGWLHLHFLSEESSVHLFSSFSNFKLATPESVGILVILTSDG